jgi:hypothetical protein
MGLQSPPHNRARHLYLVYGLEVRSEIALPELTPAAPAGVGPAGAAAARGPSVTVVRAPLPRWPVGSPAQGRFGLLEDGAFFLQIPQVARYRVSAETPAFPDEAPCAARVEIDAEPNADPSALRVFLLGSAFGAVIYQVGALPLHVSAVAMHGQGWSFTAPSGTGKSTLAAALHWEAGLPFLADDVAAVYPMGDAPDAPLLLHPGPPFLKLTRTVAGMFPDLPEPCLPPEGADPEKVRVPLAAPQHPPVPLHGVVLLSRGQADVPHLSLTPLTGAIRVPALDAALYRREFAPFFLSPEERLRLLTRIAGRVKVFGGTLPDLSRSANGASAGTRGLGHEARRELERWGIGPLAEVA